MVNPTLYEPVTTFFDLAIQESSGEVHYNNDGSITATLTMEVAKEKDASTLMFIQIDPTTGDVYYILIDSLDADTGEITATFPTLGPVMLVERSTIVVKDTTTDQYTDRTVAEIVDEFEGQTRDIEQTAVLQSMIDKSETYRELYAKTYTDEDGNTQYETEIDEETGEVHYVPNETFSFTVADKNASNYGETITITAADYTSASGFADIAIPQGTDEDDNPLYSYEMDGYYDAEAHRDINNIDWYRIALMGDSDLDEEKAENNMDLLTEIAPFVLTDSYVQLFNTETGEVTYIYEPTIYFTYLDDDEDETEVETEALVEAETEDLTESETEADTEVAETETSNSLNNWYIYDEDKDDDEKPVIVINGQYYALGSFMIFMPSSTAVDRS
ncbi:MAG: hypothetical protein LIP11_00720 [Clostridiales bacterium]|nr:hypothetical protein [Clostridiales bacterium]